MKRTIPLLITALSGFVLIFAYFVPATQSWGEVVAIWFDILAAIAFILGGGNLLKVQLQKISDRKPGWGYAAVTLIAFAATLMIGLLKLGVRPAESLEHRGESFARLPVTALPEFSVEGELPEQLEPRPLPPTVRAQLRAAGGRLYFRGWLRGNQIDDLLDYDSRLAWRCAVERLAEAAAPPAELKGVLNYYDEHESLAFKGWISPELETGIGQAVPNPEAAQAIEVLIGAARRETSVPVQTVPQNLRIPVEKQPAVAVRNGRLTIQGPLTPDDQAMLVRRWAGFPIARGLELGEQLAHVAKINAQGRPLTQPQVSELNQILGKGVTAGELRDALNTAGQASPTKKSSCDLLAEQAAGAKELKATKLAGESTVVNDAQFAVLEQFAFDAEMTPDALADALRAAGPLTGKQEAALRKKLDELPTVGERNYELAHGLLKQGRLSRKQIDTLMQDYRDERRWRRDVAQLAEASHVVKYPWSGEYSQAGSGFDWIYRYIFKPLTATIFALLAFYVASAAFRAFRAKNLEAILLLTTAFLILLGQTFAGVLLTSWLPDEFAGLRIENITMFIRTVFVTSGNRAIMIGIALGLTALSLRVLLGIDRSHLGGGDD